MKEFELIRYLAASFAKLGKSGDVTVPIGDDCSVLIPPKGLQQVTTVDSLIDGNHFSLSHFTPREIGKKSIRVNLSDLASMGAMGPYYAWLVFAIPKHVEDKTIKGIIAGIKEDCRKYGVFIAGGNITSANELSIHVTLTGWCKPGHVMKREGSRPGDIIYVTGAIGESTVAYRQFKEGIMPEKPFLRRWANPVPKVEIGIFLAKNRIASSCIDISDGIFQDLRHITRLSGTGAVLEWSDIPVAPSLKDRNPTPYMIGFGEDYELLFTVPEKNVKLLKPIEKSITRIGIISKKGFKLIDKSGKPMDIKNVGFSHMT